MPRIIDHEERRRHIIAVARGLMVDGGFAAATMRGIAAAAGFANGALKHYFDGKDAIVAATFDSVLAEMTDRNPVVTEVPAGAAAAEDLRQYIRATMPLDEHSIGGARVLLALWEYSQTNTDLRDRYLDHLKNWGGQLRDRIAVVADLPADSDEVEALVHEVITMTIGANVACLLVPAAEARERYERYATDFVARLTADKHA